MSQLSSDNQLNSTEVDPEDITGAQKSSEAVAMNESSRSMFNLSSETLNDVASDGTAMNDESFAKPCSSVVTLAFTDNQLNSTTVDTDGISASKNLIQCSAIQPSPAVSAASLMLVSDGGWPSTLSDFENAMCKTSCCAEDVSSDVLSSSERCLNDEDIENSGIEG